MFSPGREKGASHRSRRVFAACGEELSPVEGLGKPGKETEEGRLHSKVCGAVSDACMHACME